ncbi:UDP-N-acetylmuramoylalanine--D-glutamate ligase [Halothiobacillus diazotrophicus]|uniref:UDP-N-acetylmuramoylalanine--D-glutamate ligase n=1 Tax=Halothiobacillus diazotrophicus TaxID=1860122 RepID=A0A191ZJ63_9GAMM|nr:UDP-N-acetylmuramoyl-L-alanine--D-glutamate ligase [Halothiobacillus diazotrophicus]ANJ67941.1 UDP-N-acetylmuramoylalanine--D-glutamate ligase [Halothiobacillus diazotrophicus]
MSDTLIIGMGKSGLSVARHLARHGVPFRAADSRGDFDLLKAWQAEFPSCTCTLGALPADLVTGAREVIVSPGVPLTGAWYDMALALGVPVRGDIDLALHAAKRERTPTVLITGSNGKSTVTALVGALMDALDMQVGVGGNFGTPALDLLMQSNDVLVLEVSSFQIESVDFSDLTPTASLVLNISQDHLDRHGTIERYAAIKEKILHRAEVAVINRDDPLVAAMAGRVRGRLVSFGQQAPERREDFGLLTTDEGVWLAQGPRKLFPVNELGIQGLHNQMNALAALALLQGALPEIDLGDARIASVLRQFTGLPHRAQLVGTVEGIRFVDDSKATNVGAAVAAIMGMDGPLVLIAGGQGKGQAFDALAEALRDKCIGIVLIGEDQDVIAKAVRSVLGETLPMRRVERMDRAVFEAARLAVPGATVLLAPACASLDMFKSYVDRGEQFAAAAATLAVRGVEATPGVAP